MHEVLVNRLGGLSLPRKSVIRLTDRPNMTLDVYRGLKQQCNNKKSTAILPCSVFRQTEIVMKVNAIGLLVKCENNVKSVAK